jgi:membrane protease YdiL (CAAX protease family)
MPWDWVLRRCEFAKPRSYDGKGELAFAVIASGVWFLAILIRLQYAAVPWTLTDRILEATSHVLFGGIPIFFLATRPGTRFAQTILLKQRGLVFQLLVCGTLFGYLALVRWLAVYPEQFRWISQLTNLVFSGQFWLNAAIMIGGLFVIFRLCFWVLEFRNRSHYNHASLTSLWPRLELLILLGLNSLYLVLTHTHFFSKAPESDSSGYYIALAYFFLIGLAIQLAPRQFPNRLIRFDWLLATACIGSLYWLSTPFFRFGSFLSLVLFVVVVIHGTHLGREHFGYSFQIRRKDNNYLVKLVLAAVLTLIPLAILTRFANIQLAPVMSLNTTYDRLLFFLSYMVLFSFRVGVFEEVLFRCGLMTFLRDGLTTQQKITTDHRQQILLAIVLCSVVFGVCHIGNNPQIGTLSAVLYKAIYAGLATIASLFYALGLGETNRLWCSIALHGLVDTLAVVVLGVSLTVPF